MDYVTVGARFLLGIVFIAAAFGKVRAFDEFVQSLRRMKILPLALVPAAAIGTVGTEIAIVALLITPWPATGFVLAAGLLAAFTVAIGLSIRKGTNGPCRCFGRSDTPLGGMHILRNGLLIAVCLAALLVSLQSGPIELAPAIVAAFAGLVLGGLVVMFDDLIALVAS